MLFVISIASTARQPDITGFYDIVSFRRNEINQIPCGKYENKKTYLMSGKTNIQLKRREREIRKRKKYILIQDRHK